MIEVALQKPDDDIEAGLGNGMPASGIRSSEVGDLGPCWSLEYAWNGNAHTILSGRVNVVDDGADNQAEDGCTTGIVGGDHDDL